MMKLMVDSSTSNKLSPRLMKQNKTTMTPLALQDVITGINDLNTHIDNPLVSHHGINDSVDVSVHEPQTDVHSNNANDHNDNDDM